MPVVRTVIAALVLLALAVGWPVSAAAHGGVLASSSPVDGAAVPELGTMELRFSTPVLSEYSMFALTSSAGATVDLEPTFATDGRSVVLKPTVPVVPGGYRLAYRVVADDGHPSAGSIGFTVGDTEDAPPARPTAAPPRSPGLLSEERFATDRALPWVLAGTGLLIAGAFTYLLTSGRRRP